VLRGKQGIRDRKKKTVKKKERKMKAVSSTMCIIQLEVLTR
jgi:hypothetical protein